MSGRVGRDGSGGGFQGSYDGMNRCSPGGRPAYALITPARNEARFIARTLDSVAAQELPPRRWVIIDDGSEDDTATRVRERAADCPYIQLIQRVRQDSRNFASKVEALREGVRHLGSGEYDWLGFLDADVTFGPGYFRSLLERFEASPRLGLAGGQIYERRGEVWQAVPCSVNLSVAGAVQMFRRECYEAMGGYQALRRGGIDMIAETTARMLGWEVRTFPELPVLHHGAYQKGKGKPLVAAFRRGVMEYVNGYHPLFQVARFVSWVPLRPWLLLAVFRSAGYIWAALQRLSQEPPADVIRYMRWEQLRRLGLARKARPRVGPGVSGPRGTVCDSVRARKA